MIQAVGQGNVAAVGAAEQQLRTGVGQLFAVAENYPQLKSDETFKHLQARISGLEESIADRREFYNDQVNLNNIRIKVFPDAIIANAFGFGLAFFARQQRTQLFTTRQDFIANLVKCIAARLHATR